MGLGYSPNQIANNAKAGITTIDGDQINIGDDNMPEITCSETMLAIGY